MGALLEHLLGTMTLQRKILWAGMLVYAVSFILVAVGGGGLFAGASGFGMLLALFSTSLAMRRNQRGIQGITPA